ncbi:MAG: cytochrome B [Spirosomaceae bacterium]|jgi:predicted membrane channel-forming protein YqfA (hemolysin III family)|nr:cytochrome B [Spirosomataceae bacterium]
MEILIRAHSGLRYVVLGLLLAAIWIAFTNRTNPNAPRSKMYLFAMISAHVQLLLGLILYGMNWGSKVNFSMMGEKIIRFYSVEHLTGMLIAIVLITMANAQGKKQNHGKVFTYLMIALVVILASIPWPFRNLGAGWY